MWKLKIELVTAGDILADIADLADFDTEYSF